VIGSVAGDRGRRSNYVYGAAKGGLGILVQGIAHRLASSGARAVVVKPGFVDTPMTAAITKKGLLWAKPQRIAEIIIQASTPKAPRSPVIYAPYFWRWIMYVVRFMPNFIFHRTQL
jgi:NAD(P)-dependent dehydrogenase (short-subunit alcohol dehydrogenase family)